MECVFDILSNKSCFLHTEINLNMENTVSTVKAACVLHNFLRIHDGYLFEDSLMHGMEGAQWCASWGTSDGATAHEQFTSYFMSACVLFENSIVKLYNISCCVLYFLMF